MDVSAISLRGLETAQTQLEKTAKRLAAVTTDDTVDLSTEAVSMLEAKTLFQANIKAIQTESDMQKNLLDTLL
jgi:flagellar hook protein FlgE